MSGRLNILGTGIDTIDTGQALARVHEAIGMRRRTSVFFSNVHTIMLCRRHADFRKTTNRSTLTLPDGMPLVWSARMLGRHQPGRVSGPDFMLALCEAGLSRGYSHFFYGGAEGVAGDLANKLSRRFPGLRVAGAYSPPFRPLTTEEDASVVDMINGSGADVLWVGLGAPKQELWIDRHLDRLTVPAVLGVGAAFDFHSGKVKRAPAWMQKAGLEWLSRFLQDPRRLWRRYLVNNPLFVLMILGQIAGLYSCHFDERQMEEEDAEAPLAPLPGQAVYAGPVHPELQRTTETH